MGGCLQTRWSGKAKKRRLLLINSQGLVIHSAQRCGCMLDSEPVG